MVVKAEHSAVVTNVGAGFCGSTTAIMQARTADQMMSDGRLERLTIRVIDKSASFGPGEPYNSACDIFLLNQPASVMSPFPDDPDDFTRWLAVHLPGGNGDTFAPRRLYGQYLRESFQKAVQSHKDGPVKIECHTMNIDGVTCLSKGFDLTGGAETKDGLGTDALVVCDGHQGSGLFDAFLAYPGFFNKAYDIDRIDTHLKASRGPVGIIGTSQSMMDVLGVLEHLGYQREVFAFSRNLVMPWQYDPVQERAKDGQTYELKYLTRGNILAQDPSWENIEAFLEEDIKAALSAGFNPVHVVRAVWESNLPAFLPEPAGRALGRRLNQYYGNFTPPVRYDLLSRWLESGQLKTVRQHITPSSIEAQEGRFDIRGPADRVYTVSALFNAAGLSRTIYDHKGAIASPVLRDLAEQGSLDFERAESGAVARGAQKKPGLFVLGPATRASKWGVETFREDNACVAAQSVQSALLL